MRGDLLGTAEPGRRTDLETRIRKSATKDTTKSYPRTVEEAVERLLSEMNDENKSALRELPESDLITTHFGLGMYIRNQFGLWGKNAADESVRPLSSR